MTTQKRGRPKKIKPDVEVPKEIGTTNGLGRPKRVMLKYDVKPRKKRISKKAKLSGEAAYWGDEPTWTGNPKEVEESLGHAMNWYNAMATEDELKKWTIEYVKQNIKSFPADTVDKLSLLPDRLFTTVGSLARCAMQGAKVKATQLEYIPNRVREIISENKADIIRAAAKVVKPLRSIKLDPSQAKLVEAIDIHLDGYIQTRKVRAFKKFDFAAMVAESKLDAAQVKGILKYFESLAKELAEVQSDKELTEAYSNFSQEELANIISFLASLEDGLKVAPKAARTPRKVRTPKKKSPEQLLRRFKHKNSDAELKLQSVDPVDIIGADELWVYNTRLRKIGFFKSSEGGLTVKGTSIRNYDEKESYTKKLRKPGEILKQVLALGKPATKKFVAAIRSKARPLRSRINEDTILVRIF